MNKADVIKVVARRIDGATKADVETVLSVYADVVLESLSGDETIVALPGIGKFVKKYVPERRGVAQLGEKKEWVKPAHNEITFKISKNVKEI